MSNPLLSEELLSLAGLASRIKSNRRGGSVTPQAVWRWASKGVKTSDGRVVVLETVRLAGRYLTSWPAFCRFLEAQTPAVVSMPVAHRSPTNRQRQSERAAAVLTAAGV